MTSNENLFHEYNSGNSFFIFSLFFIPLFFFPSLEYIYTKNGSRNARSKYEVQIVFMLTKKDPGLAITEKHVEKW